MCPQKTKIDDAVALEWDMFQKVNEDGPRASCQEDPATFKGMREAQFRAWSDEAVASYLDDLQDARSVGRNLIQEKYLYMMAESDADVLAKLATYVKIPGEKAFELIDELIKPIFAQSIELYQRYPLVMQAGRPLLDFGEEWSTTSLVVYQRCELLTYSERTLEALKKHVWQLAAEDKSYAEQVLAYTVEYYGYKSLEKAEESLERQKLVNTYACKANPFLDLGFEEG